MKGLKIAVIVVLIGGIGWLIYDANLTPKTQESQAGSEDLLTSEISNDYSIMPGVHHENLDVFLIQRRPELTDKSYLPLSNALEKKLVTVEETSTVNELVVHNHSEQFVFIHSGDIVKGGKQDRTLAFDVILPPKTENIALQSFCVESGRWTNRGDEDVTQFNESTKMLSSKDLKAAAKYDKDQSTVWANVSEEQNKLNNNVSRLNGYDVQLQDAASATSLQLTLENEELEKAKSNMNQIYLSLAEKHPKATGFAYAINGEVYGADLYNNRNLFVSIWDRLIESVITESIANLQDTTYTAASQDDVLQFMTAVASSSDSTIHKRTEPVNTITEINITENDSGNVVFSTVDLDANQWIHQNYLLITPRNEVKDRPSIMQYNQIQQLRN